MTSHDEQLADAAANNQLTFDPTVQVELPPVPDAEPKVTVSLRLNLDDYQRVKAAAASAGTKPTALMRDWVLSGLAGADDDRTISIADLLRAVAAVPRRTAA